MASFLNITHDAGGAVADYWTTVFDAAGKLSLTTAAALGGSVWGISAVLGTLDNRTVSEPIAAPASNELRFRWRFDPNGVSVPSGTGTFSIMVAALRYSGSPRLVDTRLSYNNDGDLIFRVFKRDDNDVVNVEVVNMVTADEPHCVEVRIVRESFDGGNDGELQILLDDVSLSNTGGHQNFNAFGNLDQLVLGFNPPDVNVTGTVFADEFELDDNDQANLGCGITKEFSSGRLEGQPIDIDADGTFLYISARDDAGQPVLIQFSSALNVRGTIVFSPGAGDDIGVQCGDLDADIIYVAGFFGGNDVVAKSTDGATTFTIVDPGTFFDITAFVIGPNNDDRLYVNESNGPTFQETEDGGVTWIERNAAPPGTEPISMARLDTNHEEMVIGGEESEPEVLYSVNSGHDTEDVSGILPSANVPSLIIG